MSLAERTRPRCLHQCGSARLPVSRPSEGALAAAVAVDAAANTVPVTTDIIKWTGSEER